MNVPSMASIEKIIRINSVTERSNEEIVRFLAPELLRIGLKVREQKVVENGVTFKNIIALSHAPDAPDLLLLNTHLDTVPPGDTSAWTRTNGDPFCATQVKDRIYGLGSADVKLDFLCKMLAASQSKPWKQPFALVGTFGEERGCVGAKHLCEEGLVRPRFALVGEPSNLELIYAHKGHIIGVVAFDLGVDNVRFMEAPKALSWKGTAAHSSTPHLGKNAILQALSNVRKKNLGIVSLGGGTAFNIVPDACDGLFSSSPTLATARVLAFVEFLESLKRSLVQRKNSDFNPATCTVSLNFARTLSNGELQLMFDVRTLPETNAAEIQKRIVSGIRLVGGKLSSLSFDPPLKGDSSNLLLTAAARALKDTGTKVVKKTKATSTEAAIYNSFGVQAMVFGPGISVGNVHRPNEYNSLKQMGIATRFYTRLLSSPLRASV